MGDVIESLPSNMAVIFSSYNLPLMWQRLSLNHKSVRKGKGGPAKRRKIVIMDSLFILPPFFLWKKIPALKMIIIRLDSVSSVEKGREG
jgi:hypothetical protein